MYEKKILFVCHLTIGHETKSMLNNSGPRTKRSKLERDINVEILSSLGILFVLCLTGSIGI